MRLAFVLVQRQAPIVPHAMGLSETLNMVNHTGLPKWLSIDERRGMRLAIANALQNKNVTRTEPVKTYTQMQLTLEDRQQRKNSSEGLVKVTIYYPNVTYIYCSNCYYNIYMSLFIIECHINRMSHFIIHPPLC